jgi:hypothetical protein
MPFSLFIFIDESGNFDFSDKGTDHFVMACVATLSPLDSARARMWAALAGFLLMVLAGVTSYKKARAKMSYETWWMVHHSIIRINNTDRPRLHNTSCRIKPAPAQRKL